MIKKKNKKKEEVLPLKVDLACGQNKQAGFVGVDCVKLPGVDVVHNLDKTPWPFKNDSVSEVHCSHYVEHTQDLVKFMNELHRILKPGGTAVILAPYYNSIRCWQDPYHRRAISEASFLYFNKGWRVSQKLDHYPIEADFDYNYFYHLSPEWASRSEETKIFAIRHYMNVVNDIQFNLTKKIPEK